MGIFEVYCKIWGDMLTYNNIEGENREFSIGFFSDSVLLGALAAAILWLYGTPLYIQALAAVIVFILTHVIVYTYMLLSANSRAAKVEEVLPDFLSLMASNINSGLTPDRALIVSAREEFGPLAEEVDKAAKQSLTGKSVDEVIGGIGKNVSSEVFRKTMRLIVDGMQSGGDLVEVLEKTSYDVRKFRSVRREINSIILNYVLFIVAAVTFGAPLLYGVATFLVEIMLKIKKNITTAAGGADLGSLAGQVGLFRGQLLFTPEAVTLFASAAILITIFFGCMAIGVMRSGKKVDGLKYFPVLSAIALFILFFIKFALTTLLGGLMGP